MYQPQLILACYGMNDGLMQAFDRARFQAYQEGNIRLKKAADAAKAEIVFITPPLFRGDSAEQAEYDAVLDKYAEWLEVISMARTSKRKRRLESHRYPSRASETHCQREGRESRFQVFR